MFINLNLEDKDSDLDLNDFIDDPDNVDVYRGEIDEVIVVKGASKIVLSTGIELTITDDEIGRISSGL